MRFVFLRQFETTIGYTSTAERYAFVPGYLVICATKPG
jgi:hypothetical protein